LLHEALELAPAVSRDEVVVQTEVSEAIDQAVLTAHRHNFVERILIAAAVADGKGILSRVSNAGLLGGFNGLRDQFLWLAVTSIVGIDKLQSSEVEPSVVFGKQVGDNQIAVVLVRVVISRGDFCSMRWVPIPPMNSRDLSSDRSASRTKDRIGGRENLVCVIEKLLLVPTQKELSIGGSVIVVSVGEETRV